MALAPLTLLDGVALVALFLSFLSLVYTRRAVRLMHASHDADERAAREERAARQRHLHERCIKIRPIVVAATHRKEGHVLRCSHWNGAETPAFNVLGIVTDADGTELFRRENAGPVKPFGEGALGRFTGAPEDGEVRARLEWTARDELVENRYSCEQAFRLSPPGSGRRPTDSVDRPKLTWLNRPDG